MFVNSIVAERCVRRRITATIEHQQETIAYSRNSMVPSVAPGCNVPAIVAVTFGMRVTAALLKVRIIVAT